MSLSDLLDKKYNCKKKKKLEKIVFFELTRFLDLLPMTIDEATP